MASRYPESRTRRTTSIILPGAYRVDSESSDDDDLIFLDDDPTVFDDDQVADLSVADIDIHDENSRPPEAVLSSMASSSLSALPLPSSSRRRSAAMAAGSVSEEHPDESPAKRMCENEEPSSLPKFNLTSSQGNGEEECLFCADGFNNSTTHRLVALKCGHCFGESCVEKWIRAKSKCPTCNAKSKLKDFRPLYINRPNIIDTSQIDKLKKEIDTERKLRFDVDTKLAEAQSLIDKLRAENDNLKQDLLRLKDMSTARKQTVMPLANKTNNPSMRDPVHVRNQYSSAFRSFVNFKSLRTITIDREERCRALASSKNLETIAVSLPSSNNVFKGCGVKKVSTMDFTVSEYIHLHSSTIKDMAFKPDDILLLTASDDSSMKLTSIPNMSVVSTFKPGSQCWSCCWHPTRKHSCFVGLQNGTIQEYDIRKPTGYVREFKTETPMPLTSVQYVHPSFQANNKFKISSGILCNTLRTAYYIGVDESGNPTSIRSLGPEGPLLPVHYDHESGIGVISQRPSTKQGGNKCMTHNVMSFIPTDTDPVPFKPIDVFNGGTISETMTRPKVFCNPDSFNANALVLVGDEAQGGLLCYDSENKKVEQTIRTETDVMDIEVVLSQATQLRIAALTKKGITFYERAIQTR